MATKRATYGAGLRITLRNTAAAYGYTLSIATTIGILTSTHGRPDTPRLFLFAIGGFLAFSLLEAILRAIGPSEQEPDGAFPLAGALNVISVCAALAAATGIAHAVHGTLVWLVAPLVATSIYMAVVALQVAVVDALRSRR